MRLKRAVGLFVVLSICIKLSYLFISGAYADPQPFEYETIATNLLDGGGFYYDYFNTRYHAYLPPGFPVLCYFVYKIFGHHKLLIILLQVISTSFLAVPITLIARRIFDEKTAILSGFLAAVYPPLVIYSTTKLHTLSIDTLLFALCVLSFFTLAESFTIKRGIATGLICGTLTLFRTTSVLFVMAAILWIYVSSRETGRKRLLSIFTILLIYFLILLPWGIRNYKLFGDPLMGTTNKFESLWYGNIPGSSGSLYAQRGLPLYDKMTERLPPEFFKMGEVEQGRYLMGLVRGYFKSDPAAYMSRIIKKIYYFWYFSPNQGSMYPALWMKIYKIIYAVILPMSAFSIIYNLIFLERQKWLCMILVLALFLSLTLIHSLYYVEARHRWAIEPLLMIFAANTMVIPMRGTRR